MAISCEHGCHAVAKPKGCSLLNRGEEFSLQVSQKTYSRYSSSSPTRSRHSANRHHHKMQLPYISSWNSTGLRESIRNNMFLMASLEKGETS